MERNVLKLRRYVTSSQLCFKAQINLLVPERQRETYWWCRSHM